MNALAGQGKTSKGRLADSLFRLVEYDQGRAFVSDGLGAPPSAAHVIAAARLSLRHTERTARRLRRWLREHDP